MTEPGTLSTDFSGHFMEKEPMARHGNHSPRNMISPSYKANLIVQYENNYCQNLEGRLIEGYLTFQDGAVVR